VVGLVPAAAMGGDNVGVVVLKEHGIGTSSQGQPYLDKLMGVAAKQNGWANASGSYQTTRAGAEAYITADKPHYGFLSLAPFLAFRKKFNAEAIGTVQVANAGGQQYFLISKTAGAAADCKGKKLATDHGDDPRFIDNVVFDGKFALGDFTLVTTTRPTQTLKKLLGDEADCALIDDAQKAELSKIDGGAAAKVIWTSARFPALVVVAFPAAPAAERKTFQEGIGKLCEGDGKQACTEIGIQALKPSTPADYAAVIAAYKP
jgi:hypothetical protein